MNRRNLIVASAIAMAVALAALGAVAALRSRGPSGELDAVLPIDAESAIVCGHDAADGAVARGWLARVERGGTVRWVQPLPGLPLGPERGGVQLGGGIVTVRAQRFEGDGGPAVVTQGYDAATGERRWELEQPYEPALQTAELASDDRLLLSLDQTLRLTALDRATGEVRWRGALDGSELAGVGMRLTRDHVLIESSHAVDFFALGDGTHTHLDTRGAGCDVGSAFVALVRRGDGDVVALVEVSPDAPGDARKLVEPVQLDVPGGAGGHPFVEACGTYGDLTVLLVRYESLEADAPGGSLALLALDRRSGSTSFTLDLDASQLAGSPARNRDGGSLSGELTRFLPLVFEDRSQGSGARIAIVDLDERRVAHPGSASADLVGCGMVRATERYHRLAGDCAAAGTTIALIDGSTGVLAAARQSRTALALGDPGPAGARDGALWVVDRDPDGWERTAWGALDVATLAPIAATTVELEDATDRVAGVLGLEAARPRAPQ